MSALRPTFFGLFVSACGGTACRARSWVGSSFGFEVADLQIGFLGLLLPALCSDAFVAAAFRGGRFCLPSNATISPLCAPGFSFSRHHFPELEGGLPFAPFAKGGLFRSNATAPPLSPLGFLFHESRFTNHASLPPKAHP